MVVRWWGMLYCINACVHACMQAHATAEEASSSLHEGGCMRIRRFMQHVVCAWHGTACMDAKKMPCVLRRPAVVPAWGSAQGRTMTPCRCRGG